MHRCVYVCTMLAFEHSKATSTVNALAVLCGQALDWELCLCLYRVHMHAFASLALGVQFCLNCFRAVVLLCIFRSVRVKTSMSVWVLLRLLAWSQSPAPSVLARGITIFLRHKVREVRQVFNNMHAYIPHTRQYYTHTRHTYIHTYIHTCIDIYVPADIPAAAACTLVANTRWM